MFICIYIIYYIWVLILQESMCPHTSSVLILLYVSSYYYVCPDTTIYVSSYYVSSYYYIFVLILLCLCPHATKCVSSHYYICPHTTIYVSAYY